MSIVYTFCNFTEVCYLNIPHVEQGFTVKLPNKENKNLL